MKSFTSQTLPFTSLDIQLKQLAELALEDIPCRLQQLFGNLNFQVYWKTVTGEYRWCNERQAFVVGYRRAEDIVGKTVYTFCQPESAAAIEQIDNAVITTLREQTLLEEAKMTDGQLLKTLSIKRPLITSGGNVMGMLGVSIPQYINRYQIMYYNLLLAGLSSQQAYCLIGIVRGYTSQQVADQLKLSKRTVESYLEVIKNKFACLNRQELIETTLQNYFS